MNDLVPIDAADDGSLHEDAAVVMRLAMAASDFEALAAEDAAGLGL